MRIRGAGRWLLAVLLLAAGTVRAADSEQARARYREGAQALAEQRYDDARTALREAVRLDPDFAGAWLDLALATYAAGDPVQAEELLDTLQARFEVPQRLIEVITGLRRQIAARLAPPAPAAVWRWHRQFSAAAGHDSNANAGLAQGALTLTLPGGDLVLPLAAAARQRADAFAETGIAAAGSRRYTSGALELTAGVHARRNADVTDFDTAELRAGLAWVTASHLPALLSGGSPGVWRLRAETEQLRLDGRALSDTHTLGAEHQWLRDGCRPRLAAEIERRGYPVARTLDADYLWLGGELRCPAPLGPGSRQLAIQLRSGAAFARHGGGSARARPGGDSRHLELTAAHEWGWGGPTGPQTLRLLAQWERVRDTDGYSPLLASGARRHIDRGIIGLAWSAPLRPGSDWRFVLAAQQFRQSANLQPFELAGGIARIGVERTW